MKWLERLKQRWGVKNYFDVVLILAVFACTGFTILYTKRWLTELLGFDANTSGWLRWSFSLFVILPLYQVILLMYGWIFGKFSFFWNFEKRMFRFFLPQKRN